MDQKVGWGLGKKKPAQSPELAEHALNIIELNRIQYI